MPNLELIDKIVPINENDFPLLESAYFDAEFIPTRIYKKDRIVSYLGEFYYSLVETTDNVTPDLSPEWKKFPTGNFIPLTGTEVDKPVTGNVQVVSPFTLTNLPALSPLRQFFGFNLNGSISISSSDEDTGDNSNITVGTLGININSNDTAILITGLGLRVNSLSPAKKGLYSTVDYTANITALDYTQKKYVDEKVDSGNLVTVTYGDLVALIGDSLLKAGQKYLVSDYETRHQIDGTANLNDNNVVEPLLCVASGVNTLFGQVYSPSNANDIIFWDYANNLCEDGTTARTGKITRRIDTIKNIDTYWDFRVVQVERSGIKYLSIPTDAKDIVVGKCSAANYNYNDLKLGTGCHSITFGIECRINTLGNNCTSNIFGVRCNSNNFGDGCYSNTFGDECSSNAFGADCYSNAFGNECSFNIFGTYCYFNTFGNDCDNNTFGNDCYSNAFGYNCDNNIFGNDCYSNSFGDECGDNTFGDTCSNTFGNECYLNTFGNDCYYNTFGNQCYSNTFGIDCYLITFSNGVSNKDFTSVTPTNLSILIGTASSQTFVIQASVQDIVYSMINADGSLLASLPTVVAVSANTTLAYNAIYKVDDTSGNLTLTLPTAIGNMGKSISVLKTNNTTNTITIQGTGGQTINGDADATILYQNTFVTFISDGSNFIIS